MKVPRKILLLYISLSHAGEFIETVKIAHWNTGRVYFFRDSESFQYDLENPYGTFCAAGRESLISKVFRKLNENNLNFTIYNILFSGDDS